MTAETLRTCARHPEVDEGRWPGATTVESEKVLELRREVRELRRANVGLGHRAAQRAEPGRMRCRYLVLPSGDRKAPHTTWLQNRGNSAQGLDGRDQAAVDTQDGPGDVGGRGTRKERHSCSVLVRLAVAAHRDDGRAGSRGLLDRLPLPFGSGLVELANSRSGDSAWNHNVHRDAVSSDLARKGLRPAKERHA
jgi:hypothetical protein